MVEANGLGLPVKLYGQIYQQYSCKTAINMFLFLRIMTCSQDKIRESKQQRRFPWACNFIFISLSSCHVFYLLGGWTLNFTSPPANEQTIWSVLLVPHNLWFYANVTPVHQSGHWSTTLHNLLTGWRMLWMMSHFFLRQWAIATDWLRNSSHPTIPPRQDIYQHNPNHFDV